MSPSPPFAGRTRVFVSICAFSFLVNFGRVGFAPLLDPFMSTFGVGEATAGLIATAAWLGSALPRLPTGFLLTRVRRHVVILGMGAFLAVAAAVTSLATSVRWIGVGALLLGLASGVFFIAANPLVSELFPDRVGLAIGLRGMSSQLAAVSAPGLVGAALFLGSWRLVYRGMALAALLVLAGFWLSTRRAELPDAGAADRDLLAAFRAQWRLVLAGIALIGAIGFVWQGVFNFYVSYLASVKGIDPGTGRSLLTLVFVAGLPAFVLTGRIADRVPYLPLLFAIIAAFVGLLLALTAAEGVLAVAAVSALMGYVVHSFFPVMDTYMLDSLPDANRASAYAVYSATMMLLQAPGSLALGAMVEAGAGYTAVFRGYGVALAAMLVGLLALHRAGKLPAGGRPGEDRRP